MESIRNNKFTTVFAAIMVIGVGVLGYLLYSSYSHYDEVSQEYDKQVKELQRLQALKPYPDSKGLQKYSEYRQSYGAAVNALQAKLASFEPPPDQEVPTPIQFADRLRKTVEEISSAAQGVGMALPANFYMGFEAYRGAPPDAAVTPLLSRQLDAMVDLMRVLIKQRAVSLNVVKRAPLPREPGGPTAPAPAAAGAPRSGANAAPAASSLIVRHPVEIAFTAQPSAFREIVNAITAAERLYIIRALEIKNKEPKGPLREDPLAMQMTGGVPQPPQPPSDPGPNGVPNPPLPANGPPPLRYVVGLEKVDADLRIELVKVEPPQGGAK